MMNWPIELKKTKQRLLIWEILSQSDRPLSIIELQEKLTPDIWLSTVYRVLDSFEKHNMIRKINLVNSGTVVYEVNVNRHVHYAICVNCKTVIELAHCPMDLFEHQLKDQQFKIIGHHMEIFGLCEACQNS